MWIKSIEQYIMQMMQKESTHVVTIAVTVVSYSHCYIDHPRVVAPAQLVMLAKLLWGLKQYYFVVCLTINISHVNPC